MRLAVPLGHTALQHKPSLSIPHPLQFHTPSFSPVTPLPNYILSLKSHPKSPIFTHFRVNSQQTHTSVSTQDYEDEGIDMEFVKILAKFKTRQNYIRVLEVSRRADHPLAGSRLLLLDGPGNIHSISFLLKSLTDSYYDVLATIPPILPPGPLGILGFGAGSAARLILEMYPQGVIHGWELDPAVISVGREYFGLAKLEKLYSNRLFINIGNALEARVKDGFSGLLVDLYSKGCLIPELQNPQTWENLKGTLREGGRIMVNVGGRCVEPEDGRRDGKIIMEETLEAMHQVFPGKLFVLNLGKRKEDSSLALTGGLPDVEKWREALPKPLKFYVDMWKSYKV